MKRIIFLVLLNSVLLSEIQANYTQQDTIFLPEGFEFIEEVVGDLDKDGIEEKVIVCFTNRFIDDEVRRRSEGKEREIRIYKRQGNNWKFWYKSNQPIDPFYEDYGFEDSFEGISIKRGCIVINYFYGGRTKAVETKRFRYQNELWELIGFTAYSFTSCRFTEELDYNLSTGKIIYSRLIENCEDEDAEDIESSIEFYKKLPKLPNMDNLLSFEVEIKVPDFNRSFYL